MSSDMCPIHFQQLQSELEPLISELQQALSPEPQSCKQIGHNWQIKPLALSVYSSVEKMEASIKRLSREVLEPSSVDNQTVKAVVESISRALYPLMSEYQDVCNSVFPRGCEIAHECLISIQKRTLEHAVKLLQNLVKCINVLKTGKQLSDSDKASLLVTVKCNSDDDRLATWLRRNEQYTPTKFRSFFRTHWFVTITLLIMAFVSNIVASLIGEKRR